MSSNKEELSFRKYKCNVCGRMMGVPKGIVAPVCCGQTMTRVK